MSFFSISDPIERERVVQDYKRLKQEIQERNERNKITGQHRNRMLQEAFHPVVTAQTDMAEKIVESWKEVNPIKQEKTFLKSKKRRLTSDNDGFGPLANAYRNRWMSRDTDIDTSFGINFVDGEPYIARTPIKIQNDDIIIYHEVYPATSGLWRLITEKSKAKLEGKYDPDDLAEYEGILRQTYVLYEDFNPNSSYPRSSNSWKWKIIFRPVWDKLMEENENDKLHEGSGLIIKKFGRIWKGKRHAGEGYRKWDDGIYSENGNFICKL